MWVLICRSFECSVSTYESCMAESLEQDYSVGQVFYVDWIGSQILLVPIIQISAQQSICITRNGDGRAKVRGCAEFIHIVEDNDIAQRNPSANSNGLALFVEFSSHFIFEPTGCQNMQSVCHSECDCVFLYVGFEVGDERGDAVFFGACELGVSLVVR